MKKLVSLLLALILVMSIAPAVVAEEAPTKLTYGSVMGMDDFSEYEIFKELAAKLNIELEVTNYDYDSLSVE